MNLKHIQRATFLRLFRISCRLLYDWQNAGYFTSVTPFDAKTPYFEVQKADEFLAARSHNFTTPPTIQSLRDKKVVLLKPNEVQNALSIGQGRYLKYLKEGRLSYLQINKTIRVDAASVQRLRRALRQKRIVDKEEGVTRRQAAHILSVDYLVVLPRLIAQGLLEEQPGPTARQRLITRKSLAALIASLLVTPSDPYAWIEDRLATDKPLLSMGGALSNWPQPETLPFLIETGQVKAIRHVLRDRILVAPESLLGYIEETEQPHNSRLLAKQIGVTRQAIEMWDKRFPEWRVCPVHQHNDSHLYTNCVLAILRRLLSGYNASPHRWRDARLDGIPITTPGTLAEEAGISRQVIVDLINEGKIWTLRTPGGKKLFSVSALQHKWLKKHIEAARSE